MLRPKAEPRPTPRVLKELRRPPIPTGLRPKAQGWPAPRRPTLGPPKKITNPKGVASPIPSPANGYSWGGYPQSFIPAASTILNIMERICARETQAPSCLHCDKCHKSSPVRYQWCQRRCSHSEIEEIGSEPAFSKRANVDTRPTICNRFHFSNQRIKRFPVRMVCTLRVTSLKIFVAVREYIHYSLFHLSESHPQ